MNNDEKKLLADFLHQLKAIHGLAKDPEAHSMIEAAVKEQPDAAYLLVQKALLQDQALNAARLQISDLQKEVEALRAPNHPPQGGFLSHNPWAAPATARPVAMSQVASPAPVGAAPPAPSSVPGGFGSFLGSAAATAAGVAGGAFLFQGLGNLFGHHGVGSGFDPTNFDGAGHSGENITINEYYGDAAAPRASDVSNDAGFSGEGDFYDAGFADDAGGDDSLDV